MEFFLDTYCYGGDAAVYLSQQQQIGNQLYTVDFSGKGLGF